MLTVISIAIGSSTSSVSFPPTVATFVILFSVRSSKLSTITINVLDTDSPAGTVTFFHSNLVLFSEIIAPSAEFSFNIVPVGTLSLIVVTPSTSPVFVTLIVYVISSPILATSTLLPSLVISLVLLLVIIAVFSSLLSSPFAIATFEIVPVVGTSAISPSSISTNIILFTFTVNLTNTEFASSFSLCPGTDTIHFTPTTSSFSPITVFPFIMLNASSKDTKVVFSGILSVISILFKSFSPLFVTLIVYVMFSPAYTTFSPDFVVANFSTVKSGVVGTIVSETAEAAVANTLAGVHQSQKSFDTSFSSSSTLVTVVSPTSFTLVPVVISVLFVTLLSVSPLFAVTLLFVVPLLATVPSLLLGVVTLFCTPVSGFVAIFVLSGVEFSPV